MTTLKIYQPCLFPGGRTYRVRARYADRVSVAYFDTQAEALDARDAAFDQGAHAVHVSGLPFLGVAAGFGPDVGKLPKIAD
jgi:hypothetical protein